MAKTIHSDSSAHKKTSSLPSKKPTLTPMMQQYTKIKQKHPKAILFFRLGDFYEMFGKDARIASKILQITLTSRDKNKKNAIPLCGIPYHAAEGYIARLIKAGHTVAICEQVEDPKKAVGIVKREVIRVITPGTVMDSNLLEGKENNFLGALALDAGGMGLAFVDNSTGEFLVTEYQGSDWYSKLETEFSRKAPREMIIPKVLSKDSSLQKLWDGLPGIHIEHLEKDIFQNNYARNNLKNHFQVHSLAGLGCEENNLAVLAASAAIFYLQQTQKCDLSHLRRMRWYDLNDFMIIDAATQQHLELVFSWQGLKKSGSLLSILDQTETPMGGRMLKQWLLHPLLTVEDINQRLDSVEHFVTNQSLRKKFRELLKKVYDLERISGKIALSSASPLDLISLKNSLAILPQLKRLLQKKPPALVSFLDNSCDNLQDLYQWIDECIADHPSATIQDAGVIREGYSSELDKLRQIAFAGKSWIAQMEHEERQKTGISSLKVKYNKVFGYYLEVTKANLEAVPDHYIRKQTIANGERYITAELKDYETKVLTAQEKMLHMEKSLFQGLLDRLSTQVSRLQETSRSLAALDVLTALAHAASLYHYIKPSVNAGSTIHIIEGRHPVVEQLSKEENFVPNDTHMDCEQNQLMIITGPNMAGKSTYIRQVALITLIAQIGSFVPANEATIGLVDRIFTRVGASDNLVKGQSTFMVEMTEAANILNNATNRSLIILDEIGRGTSTFDGMSIAWAVAEYLHSEEIGAKTLFATHYHELTHLADLLEKAQNYNVLVREWNDEVIFLRRIVAGSTDKSYGIQVARLAGLPSKVITRSKEILESLEKQDTLSGPSLFENKTHKRKKQLSLFTSPEDYVISELKETDFSKFSSAREALKIVKKWQKLINNK